MYLNFTNYICAFGPQPDFHSGPLRDKVWAPLLYAQCGRQNNTYSPRGMFDLLNNPNGR